MATISAMKIIYSPKPIPDYMIIIPSTSLFYMSNKLFFHKYFLEYKLAKETLEDNGILVELLLHTNFFLISLNLMSSYNFSYGFNLLICFTINLFVPVTNSIRLSTIF